MTLRYRELRWANTTGTPLETLTGGRVAKAHRILEQHRQADNALGNDRGVVARIGLHGAEAFQVPSVNPFSGTQVYPLRSVSRTVARVPAFNLLPGHFLKLSALVSPSGMTGRFAPGVSWVADIPYGRIDVIVEWGGPDTITMTHSETLVTSSETYAGEAMDEGAAWATMRRVEIPIMVPKKVMTSKVDLCKWSEGVTAAVTIKNCGGVRAFDVVVQQVPLAYARDIGTDSLFSSALVTDAVGQSLKTYPVPFPIEERSATDPTAGSLLLADIVDRQHHALGCVLAQWSAFDEASTPVSATEVPSVTTTSTTFVDMLRTSVTTWAGSNPGWSLSAGSQSMQFKSSNAHEMRGNGCVPVRCWAYASRTGASNATLRFQTEAYSICELVVTSASAGWVSATGHLRCGAHPQDQSVLEVFGRAAVGSTLSLSNIFVEYLDL